MSTCSSMATLEVVVGRLNGAVLGWANYCQPGLPRTCAQHIPRRPSAEADSGLGRPDGGLIRPRHIGRASHSAEFLAFLKQKRGVPSYLHSYPTHGQSPFPICEGFKYGPEDLASCLPSFPKDKPQVRALYAWYLSMSVRYRVSFHSSVFIIDTWTLTNARKYGA